jgi:hypothetical protein
MWHCYEMTWRTYSALFVMSPDQFPENYQQANKHVSFGKCANGILTSFARLTQQFG